MAVTEWVVYCGSLAKFNEYIALNQARVQKPRDNFNRRMAARASSGDMVQKTEDAPHQLRAIWATVKIDDGVLYWIHKGRPIDGFEEFHPS